VQGEDIRNLRFVDQQAINKILNTNSLEELKIVINDYARENPNIKEDLRKAVEFASEYKDYENTEKEILRKLAAPNEQTTRGSSTKRLVRLTAQSKWKEVKDLANILQELHLALSEIEM